MNKCNIVNFDKDYRGQEKTLWQIPIFRETHAAPSGYAYHCPHT